MPDLKEVYRRRSGQVVPGEAWMRREVACEARFRRYVLLLIAVFWGKK